jgi:hypothetical protein
MGPDRRIIHSNAAAVLLLAIGSLQMIGFAANCPSLRGIGAAWGCSPLPKVFSAVRGYETFATEFYIVYELGSETRRIWITPELYQKLSGPYNRRNVFGAVLSYGPVLPRSLWLPVLQYGLDPAGPIRREMGIPDGAQNVRVEIQSLTRGKGERWTLNPEIAAGCDK